MLVLIKTPDSTNTINTDTLTATELRTYVKGVAFRREIMRRIFYSYYDATDLTKSELTRIMDIFDRNGVSFMALLDNEDLENARLRLLALKNNTSSGITDSDYNKILGVLM